MMSKLVLILFLFSLFLSLNGCGGGGGGGVTVSNGVFLGSTTGAPDSFVVGLTYTSLPSVTRGVTDGAGTFRYKPRDSVTFDIRGFDLPGVGASSIITPNSFSFYGPYTPQNLEALFTALDSSPDPGIQLPAADFSNVQLPPNMTLEEFLNMADPDQFAIEASIMFGIDPSDFGVTAYTIYAQISGLDIGNSLVLENNGRESLTFYSSDNGIAKPFTIRVAAGSDYNVTVLSQPDHQWCSIPDGVGTANSDVTVHPIVAQAYSVSGTITGLTGTGLVLQNNGGDNLPISANGDFTFDTYIAAGDPYNVTVLTHPSGQSCTITNGSGTIPALGGNVNTVTGTCTNGGYTVSVLIPSFTGTLVLQNNGGDNLTVNAASVPSFPYTTSFSTPIPDGSPYSISVLTNPVGLTTTILNGINYINGLPALATASFVASYYVYVHVTDLPALSTLQLQMNGGPILQFFGSGGAEQVKPFTNGLADSANYQVTVLSHPSGALCTISGGNSGDNDGTGFINGANVGDIFGTGAIGADCEPSYTVSLNVDSNISGTLVLQNNGGDNLTITGPGYYTFETPVLDNTDYEVTVLTHPAGQLCTIYNGGPATSTTNITNITASFQNSYLVGVRFIGDGINGTLILQNEDSLSGFSETLTLTGNSNTTFPTPVVDGHPYNITVVSHPTDQRCLITNGSASSSFTNQEATCNISTAYRLSVDVPDFTGTLVLENMGLDPLTITDTGDGTGPNQLVTFATPVPPGAPYNVTVATYPDGQYWEITPPASGNMPTNDLTLNATYQNAHTVSVNVSGLGTGKTLILQNEISQTTAPGVITNTDTLIIETNGPHTFNIPLVDNTESYNIVVATYPADQSCTLSNESGNMLAADISNVGVICQNSYTVSVNISGLSGVLVLQNNGGDDLTIDSSIAGTDSTTTFATPVIDGQPFNVTVATYPVNQLCTIANGSGTSSTDRVVTATCLSAYTLGVTVTGLTGSGFVLQNNGGDDLPIPVNGTYYFATPVVSGSPYNVTVLSHPTGQRCTLGSESGFMANGSTFTVSFDDAYTVGINVIGLLPGRTLVLQNNGLDDLTITENNRYYVFPTPVLIGTGYNVTVLSHPDGQLCTINLGTGSPPPLGSNIENLSATFNLAYFVNVTISGPPFTTPLILENMGETLTLASKGAETITTTFQTPIIDGGSYEVTVQTHPTNTLCKIYDGGPGTSSTDINALGVISGAHLLRVEVPPFTGTLILQNNGGDELPFTGTGSTQYKYFDTPVTDTSTYHVTVLTHPSGQLCTLNPAIPTVMPITGAPDVVANFSAANPYEIGIAVTGLNPGETLILQNNGGDDLTITENKFYKFATRVNDGQAYDITVLQHPDGQLCEISGGQIPAAPVPGHADMFTETSGNIAGENEFNIFATLHDAYKVNVTVTGPGIADSLTLQNNGGDDLVLSTGYVSGTFAIPVLDGDNYEVTVSNHPTNQLCTITNGGPAPSSSDVTATAAITSSRILRVSVPAFSGELVLQNNGKDDLPVTGDPLNPQIVDFVTPVSINTNYLVTVLSHPNYEAWTITPAVSTKMTVAGATVAANFVTTHHIVDVSVDQFDGTLVLQNNGGDDLTVIGNPLSSQTTSFPTAVPVSGSYDVTVLSHPDGLRCDLTNEAGTVPVPVALPILASFTTAYRVGVTVDVDPAATSLILQNNSDILVIDKAGYHEFATPIVANTVNAYNITVVQHPSNQLCELSAGQVMAGPVPGHPTIFTESSGIMNAYDEILDVTLHAAYRVSLNLQGTPITDSVTLQNNGGDDLTFTSTDSLPLSTTFATPVLDNDNYEVTVTNHPAGQLCLITNGGPISSTTNVTATATIKPAYSVSVVIPLFTGTLVLQNNGGDDLTVSGADSPLTTTFATPVAVSTDYHVTVLSEPDYQDWTMNPAVVTQMPVGGAADVIASFDYTDYFVSVEFPLGFTGDLVLQNNGGDDLAISNAPAGYTTTFATPIPDGDNYAVTVLSHPNNLLCTITGGETPPDNGSGTVPVPLATPITANFTEAYHVGVIVDVAPNATDLILQNNSETLVITAADGAGYYEFPTPLAYPGGTYDITVVQHPSNQLCELSTGQVMAGPIPLHPNIFTEASGTITDSDEILNVTLHQAYRVSLKVQGTAISDTVTLQNNGGDDLTFFTADSLPINTTFPTPVLAADPYEVTVTNHPSGQVCSLTYPSDKFVTATIAPARTLWVEVQTAFTGKLVLQNNLGESLTITDALANDRFQFATPVAVGANYHVTVLSEPDYQDWTMTPSVPTAMPSLLVQPADVIVDADFIYTDYLVEVNFPLGFAGDLVLQNNGGDDLAISNAPAGYTTNFSTAIPTGDSYAVTVLSHPDGLLCTITGGDTITNIGDGSTPVISPITATFVAAQTVGVSVIGLDAGKTLELRNTVTGPTLPLSSEVMTITSNGFHIFPIPVVAGNTYLVEVETDPTDQECILNSATGVIVAGTNVTDVLATHGNVYTVSVQVAGYNAPFWLQNNGGDDLQITNNGTFTFYKPMAPGDTYNVTVLTHPTNKLCTIENGTGTIGSSDVIDVEANLTEAYRVSVNFPTGFTGDLVLQNNGGDDLAISNAPLNYTTTFAIPIAKNGDYKVTILTHPLNNRCFFTDSVATPLSPDYEVTGNVGSSNVTVYTDFKTAYTVTVNVATFSGVLELQNLTSNPSSEIMTITGPGSYPFPTPVDNLGSYQVSVVPPHPTGLLCEISGGKNLIGGGTLTDANVLDIYAIFEASYLVNVKLSGVPMPVGETLILQNNGIDNLTIDDTHIAGTTYQFGTPVNDSDTYEVTVSQHPAGRKCVIVSDGSGTGPDDANVLANLVLGHTVGGEINDPTSAAEGTEITLQNTIRNGASIVGTELTTVTISGLPTPVPYTFHTPVEEGYDYEVTVASKPAGFQTTVTGGTDLDGTGKMGNIDVTDVDITLSEAWNIQITVTNFIGTKIHPEIILENEIIEADGVTIHAVDTLTITTNGVYTFPIPLIETWTYDISITEIEEREGTLFGGDPLAGGMINGGVVIDLDCGDSITERVMTHPLTLADNLSDDNFNVGKQDDDKRSTSVAINNSGNILIAWTQETTQAASIFYVEYPSGGTPPAPTEIYVGETYAEAPTVALNDDGRAIIAWRQVGGATVKNYIYSAFKNSDLDGWTYPANLGETFSEDVSGVSNPVSAISKNGTAIVAWTAGGGSAGDSDVYFRHYIDYGTGWDWRDGTGNIGYEQIAIRNESYDYLDKPATPSVAHIKQIAMNDTGKILMSWDELGSNCPVPKTWPTTPTSFTQAIFMAEFDPSPTPVPGDWTFPTTMSLAIPGAADPLDPFHGYISPSYSNAYDAGVALDNNDNAVICWRQEDEFVAEGASPTGTDYIMRATYNVTGTGIPLPALGWDFPGGWGDNYGTLGPAFAPSVAMGGNFHHIMSWAMGTSSVYENQQAIYRLEFDGGPETINYGSEGIISTTTSAASGPVCAMSPDGKQAVIVWQQNDGLNQQVYISEMRTIGAVTTWYQPRTVFDTISADGTETDNLSEAAAINNDSKTIAIWSQSDGTKRQLFKSEYK